VDAEQKQTAVRVVVVDDDPLVLAVTKRVLGRLGYTVATFEDARRALSDVAHTHPFALVADLHMPDMDGSELLRLVQQVSPETYRLLYTGEGRASELERALAPGLTHAVVPKVEGNRLLPEALARLRATPVR
jgi:CheY-like chemotaxis protein